MVRGQFNFDTKKSDEVGIKVALSSVSMENAKLNFEAEGKPSFDEQKALVQNQWKKVLEGIEVEGGTDREKTIFYTAIYHSFTAPTTFSDVNNEWRGADPAHSTQKGNFTKYSTFSLWDTFRAVHPLLTISHPELVNDMINSLLAFYQETGKLPLWELANNDTNCMWGYHAVSVIGEAYLKGFRDYDIDLAYMAMKTSAMQDVRYTDLYKEFGYIPFDKTNQSVSKALEYAYGDWVLAQVAKDLGKEEDYKLFMSRSEYWKNNFDGSTGFLRAKDSKGQWRPNFDPLSYGGEHHTNDEKDYIEGNGWQYVWYVLHDIPTLVDTLGGYNAFDMKLDSLFTLESTAKGSADISGLIGNYVHGNEPSHHVAFMYNKVDKPWKTQERVLEILDTQYDNTPEGIAGNEDCGQMSAWFVLASTGLYPVTPASGEFEITTPIFDKTTYRRENGTQFTIEVHDRSKTAIYIQKVLLNSKPLKQSYINFEDLEKDGKLEIFLGKEKKKFWKFDS